MQNQNYIRICITFIIACFLFIALNAQDPHLIFTHLTVEDGLSQSTVHAILQDKDGFMWFGTEFGLNKYDGNKFTVYKYNAQDTTSISSNFIVEIFEDSYGQLWIGNGFGGLNLFDRESEIFKRYNNDINNPGSISNNNIRSIFEDSHKNLWIGTSGGGLNLFDRSNNTFKHIRHDSQNLNSLGSDYISSIAEDRYGNLWLGSTEGVLCKYNPDKNSYTNLSLYNEYIGNLFNTTFGSLYIDSEDNVWFGTEIGLFVYNQSTRNFTHYQKGYSKSCLNTNAVSSILELEKDIFLIATDHGGLNVLNRKTGEISYYLNVRYDETSIKNNQLYTIYRSPDSIIWIGSFHGGINIYDRKAIKFQQYKYLLSEQDVLNCCNSVLTLCEDKNRKIWIGNDGQGIDIYNPSIQSVEHLTTDPNDQKTISSNIITKLYRDSEDDIWIGTYLEGMYKYDWETKQFQHFKNDPVNPSSIGGNNVWCILEDSQNLLWLGIMGSGLDVYDRSNNTFKHFKNDPGNQNSITNNDVFNLFEDNKGTFWVGTRNGLNILNRETGSFKRIISDPKDYNSLFGTWIYEIFQDSRDNIWIGTDIALNLYRPETNNFSHFMEMDGLPGSAILGILEDRNHRLWLSTNKGISRFDPVKKTFRNFDVADGLQGDEFNYASKLISKDGIMYFGGKNGFNVFNPDNVLDNTTIPPVFITNFSYSDKSVNSKSKNYILTKSVNSTKKIQLSYSQDQISIEFASLNYTNSRKNQYAYLLEGFDPEKSEWNYAGNKHDVTYTNLNPGQYTFRVKGSNNDGIWNEKGTSIDIIITPPFWKAKWFYGLELFMIVALIYLLIIYREKKLKKDKKILQEKVSKRTLKIEQQKEELEQHRNHLENLIEHRTEELIAAKEKAEESDMLKSAFLANMSHEIRTPMNAIVGFSSLLKEPNLSAEERENYISLINSNSESLLVIIEDILDLSLIEANQIIIRKEVFSVNELLDNINSSFAVSNKKPDLQIRLNNSLKTKNIRLNSDKFRTKQILANLMNNAYKFTDKGYIELGVDIQNTQLIFYVKDTGIGIPKKIIKYIFDRFRKLEQDNISPHRGAGLGLAISKRLVELLGGDIWVESNLGVGSTFYFSIPYESSIEKEPDFAELPKATKSYNWSNRNILIVEDEKTNFLYLKKALKKTNAKIVWAENGTEAIKLLSPFHNFDIILMDIKMPVMDGYEAASIIKSQFPEQVIIAQTAYAGPEDEYKLRKAGFNDYLSKPIRLNYLYTVIEKHL